MFGRLSKRSSRFFRLHGAASHGLHFVDPPNGEGEGEGEPVGGGAGAATAPAAQAAPDHRLGEALKERKKAKGAFNSLLRGMGLDPATVRVVSTGDPTSPYRIEGIPDLDGRLRAAQAFGGAVSGGGSNGRGRNGAAASVEVATITAQRDSLQKQRDALIEYIKQTAIIQPLRDACRLHGAIDDDNGRFDDIVSQLAPLWRAEVEFDADDTASKPDVRVYAVSGNGAPLINPTANLPATATWMVSDFLQRRPKYRKAEFRSGPGAGGNAIGAPRAGAVSTTPTNGNGHARTLSPEAATARAIEQYSGGAVRAADLIGD